MAQKLECWFCILGVGGSKVSACFVLSRCSQQNLTAVFDRPASLPHVLDFCLHCVQIVIIGCCFEWCH